jgi:ubiquinone/menaquinone biosynthesis C-methylase UbiE
MLPRVLEAEVMDTEAEAHDYDAMDFTVVNRAFVAEFLQVWDARGPVLDVCAGPAWIPIELCRRYEEMDAVTGGRIVRAWGGIRVVAVDLAEHMLSVARRNVEAAGFADRITVAKADAKRLPFPSDHFGAVLCNGSVHHIPDPFECFSQLHRVCRPGGTIFVRDLLRPTDAAALDHLVKTHAAGANDHQRAMFAASLHASLTLDEARDAVVWLGHEPETVQQTSDRHWTWSAIRSG